MIALLLALTGCATFTGARPLEPGQHEVGATVGGPLVSALGVVMPLPMIIAQGRSGVAMVGDRPFDLSYGMNLTGLPFGVIGLHGGGSFLLAHPNGAVPAVSISDRLFLGMNPIDQATEGTRGVSLVNQLELAVSWELGHHLLYVSASNYLDLRSPGLLLTPKLGARFDFGDRGGFALHTELQYWGVTHAAQTDRVDWITAGPGAIGATIGLSWTLGDFGGAL